MKKLNRFEFLLESSCEDVRTNAAKKLAMGGECVLPLKKILLAGISSSEKDFAFAAADAMICILRESYFELNLIRESSSDRWKLADSLCDFHENDFARQSDPE
ncbi:MAG: hypothetical protein V3W45_06240 [Sedimentisphaerales bacterium]